MAQMSVDLSISSSEVHAALKRLALSHLVSSDTDRNRPLQKAVEEFLVHGVKYAFPAKRGEVTRGLTTSYAARPLSQYIDPGSELPPVCPARKVSIGVSVSNPCTKRHLQLRSSTDGCMSYSPSSTRCVKDALESVSLPRRN